MPAPFPVRNSWSASGLCAKSGNILFMRSGHCHNTSVCFTQTILQISRSHTCNSFGLVFPRVNANSRRVNNSTTFIWNRTQYKSGITITWTDFSDHFSQVNAKWLGLYKMWLRAIRFNLVKAFMFYFCREKVSFLHSEIYFIICLDQLYLTLKPCNVVRKWMFSLDCFQLDL